jgi:hypothetical protein
MEAWAMSAKTDPYQELLRVLEEAVQEGVYSIGLEFEGRELMVYYQVGSASLGSARIPKEMQSPVINELVKRAGLGRKSKGKLQVTLLGKPFEVVVEEYDSFGESAYNLTLRERKAAGE